MVEARGSLPLDKASKGKEPLASTITTGYGIAIV